MSASEHRAARTVHMVSCAALAVALASVMVLLQSSGAEQAQAATPRVGRYVV